MENKLNILLLKNNLSGRSLTVRLSLLFWASLLTFTILGALAYTSYLSVRYYRLSHSADNQTREILEQELADLRRSYESLLQQQGQKTAEGPTTVAVQPPQTTTTHAPPAPEAAQKPVPPPVMTAAAPPHTQLTGIPSAHLFKILLPKATSIPIEPAAPKAYWKGKYLQIRFDLRYIHADNGSQQGKIIMIARGQNQLFAYPTNALQLSSKNYLIDPDLGEYFSVSRFRETKASIGPINSTSEVSEVEVFVINQKNELLIYQVLKPTFIKPEPVAPAQPASKPDNGDTSTNPLESSSENQTNGSPEPEI